MKTPSKKNAGDGYVELQITTNFTFLRGGSHPEELVEQALALGYNEIAITDHNTLAGIVRAHAAARGKAIRIIPACRLDLLDGPSLLAYPTNQEAYARLSGLLSIGNRRTEKGKCYLFRADVYEHAEGLLFIAIPPVQLNEDFLFESSFSAALEEYRQKLGKSFYLGATRSYQANDNKKLFRLARLAEELDIPLIATNDVHYHNPARRELQDVLTCIREKCTIYEAGFRLHQNAERFLKPISEMERLFRQYPEAVRRTKELAEACKFSLDELKYVYPEEITRDGRTPQEELALLSWEGAHKHFGEQIPENIRAAIEMELEFIGKKNYAAYFLTVYDFVRFAREQEILCQGRGSAANSVVCYCLGITSVDPSKFRLLFARFMSEARDEPPDIDVDFEHERREEVMQYIFNKYGRDRAAIVATVTQLHFKGAIRDVGKAMGLSLDSINRLSSSGWEFTEEWFEGKSVTTDGFDARDPHLFKVMDLTRQYIGFPRQLGQHTGGFVMTQGKLSDLCPILNARMENRTCIEWNKDDIETLGFLKVDVLALGMLTCIRKAFDLCRQHYGVEYTLANIPQDDPAVYAMISEADTIGVFQIESRAQMSMLPRLRPNNFYDLVIEVAIVRPGPIQGDMVHPYLRRRTGKEDVDYPSPELKEILGRTLGVPLFQEQAMEIAIVAAGFTPAEADGLRRAMATFKAKGKVSDWERKLITGMLAKGYKEDFAKRVFKQLEGFGSYGFPESHAASFALLVYVSAWLKWYYPDVFAAALLNSMPMGFYQPAQIVIDARKHGVMMRPIDINHSFYDNSLEEKEGLYCSLRLGFRQIRGISEGEMQLLTAAREKPFTTIPQLCDLGISLASLEKLAEADAFRSIGLDRRQALWEVSALQDRSVGMYQGQSAAAAVEQSVQLPGMTLAEHVVEDYSSTALSLKAHPLRFVRERLNALGVVPLKTLEHAPDGMFVRVAGLVLVRQRPGTATGICFITLEDESHFANLVVFRKYFDKYRSEIVRARLLMVEGRVQREGSVVHVVVRRCHNLSALLQELTDSKGEMQDTFAADVPVEAAMPPAVEYGLSQKFDAGPMQKADSRKPMKPGVQLEIFPSGRNFR
jgi:error-prone DNA polymerase